ncbi:MAG: type II toxin-antitoxin system VapC family toxin [Alphaproteobacteria bacterium]|jgi:predicted nucleic acid-binding protein|nr:type II toxin-antitoxin system VapC family toxin [Alphaproteobacteria bacterium]
MRGIVLDTNILSELFRPDANGNVLVWMKSQNPENLFLTVFTVGEICIGAERLPVGRKRAALESWLESVVLPNFAGRILAFDLKAANVWARLSANDRKNGRPRPTVDAMIASIALAQDLVLATRNIRDFKDLDIPLANPFD